jgi:hypothetical protein
MIGAASIYAIAIKGGTPLSIKRRTIGTTPHSHVGKTKPAPIPKSRPPARLLGIQRSIRSVETNTSIVAEKSAPMTRKGMASIKIAAAMAENTLNVSNVFIT